MIFTCKKCGFPNDLNKRSSQQNKYLHKIISIIADELGYSLEEMKTALKYEFGYYHEFADKKTGETLICYDETSKMDTKTISDFTEKIIIFANKNDMNILLPEEFYET